ncbi:MAG: orotidine-5'-phosphate decarboxylase [FCB group bacterium]|nr:orotidine-5'-phosphate decarboxylase [FCB group bacterium]
MSAIKKLQQNMESHNSLLCVGLDVDPKRMPKCCGDTIKGMCRFAIRIIEATSDIVAAYKPNMGFFEALGPDGLSLLKLICQRIPKETTIILDGKRGDIGHTGDFYAKAIFEIYGADWTTVNPYMGYDSVRPFLEYKDKGAFVLCLTSNPGARDFQQQDVYNHPLYHHVARKASSWNKDNNCGLVVGATYPDQMTKIREAADEMPILIPGVGAQGGDLEKAVMGGTDGFKKPAIINVSRSVLYASAEDDFDLAARAVVEKLNGQINSLRKPDTTDQ